jgi:hypothetical protein
MYMTRMIEVGQASNGYVVECRVPLKPKKEKESKDLRESYPGSCEKQYIAKSTQEVVDIMTRLMPLLDESFATEDAFDSAFDEAASTKK